MCVSWRTEGLQPVGSTCTTAGQKCGEGVSERSCSGLTTTSHSLSTCSALGQGEGKGNGNEEMKLNLE